METVERTRWPVVVETFGSFFAGLGTVETGDDRVSFAAPQAGTGLTLHRDGTSTSFMPLHEMGGRWERVAFDVDRREVVISGEGFSYTYRVPSSLSNG
jgi:hypothetical protein